MNSIEEALRRAAAKANNVISVDELDTIIKERDDRIAREQAEQKKLQLKLLAEQQEAAEQKERIRKAKMISANRAKTLYAWTAFIQDQWRLLSGIIWSDNKEMAMNTLVKKYTKSARISINEVDCSNDVTVIMDYYE